MVKVFDMRAGTWTDDEQDDDGVGRGGCCHGEPQPRDRRAALPRLQLALVAVRTDSAATRWPR